MDDYDRHFYLYAKGWYQDDISVLLDLKILLGHYCGMSCYSITDSDVIHKLICLVEVHITNQHQFKEFVLRVFHTKGDVNSLIQHCLTVLALVTNENLGFELGEPDHSVLPLKHLKNQLYSSCRGV
jgi:hypothetical protein